MRRAVPCRACLPNITQSSRTDGRLAGTATPAAASTVGARMSPPPAPSRAKGALSQKALSPVHQGWLLWHYLISSINETRRTPLGSARRGQSAFTYSILCIETVVPPDRLPKGKHVRMSRL